MKISKRHLRKIIREEIELGKYELGNDTTDMMLDKEYPADVEAQENSWAGGQNIHYQFDHGEAAGAESVTRGVETLKISESALRRLIRTSLYNMFE